MRDSELYAKILGIVAPWTVEDVQLNQREGEIEVRVAHNDGVLNCPESTSLPTPQGGYAAQRNVWDFRSDRLPMSAMRPWLAESWEFPDELTVVFKIRDNVFWHDKPPVNGRKLTAKDIEYNYHRYFGLGSGFTEPSPKLYRRDLEHPPWLRSEVGSADRRRPGHSCSSPAARAATSTSGCATRCSRIATTRSFPE